jgi:hypothetical protein
VNLILGDQPLGGLHRPRRVRLIVGVDDLDLHLLAADIDAARIVDRLGPEIVALLLLDSFGGERTGNRKRRPKTDGLLGKRSPRQ